MEGFHKIWTMTCNGEILKGFHRDKASGGFQKNLGYEPKLRDFKRT